MLARSTASADRPFIGRSAAAVFGLLVALIASLALGAAAARASADTQVADQGSVTDESATATASPAPADASAAPAAPAQPAASEPEPVVEEPTEPAAPPAGNEPPAETEVPQNGGPEPPATPTREQPPTGSTPAETEPTEPDPEEQEPSQPPSNSATAHNRSQTRQAIFQVQQGCKSHCQGASRSQTASQGSQTTQNATAKEPEPTVAPTAGASSDSSPEAVIERVSATWRRVAGDGIGKARIRGHSSATTSPGPGNGVTLDTRVESSALVEPASKTAKTSTATSATTSTNKTPTDFSSLKLDPPSRAGQSDSGLGTVRWVLIGLLLAFGVAMLRKTRLRRAVV